MSKYINCLLILTHNNVYKFYNIYNIYKCAVRYDLAIT